MGHQETGTLEHRDTGTLAYLDIGTPGNWDIGTWDTTTPAQKFKKLAMEGRKDTEKYVEGLDHYFAELFNAECP